MPLNLIKPISFPGCFQILPEILKDKRGEFVKPFVKSEYESLNLKTEFAEAFYSRSRRGVLRGMHFQIPPYDYYKLVSCMHGSIVDVIVDLRVGSPFYKKCEILELDSTDGIVLYLPPGIAHGFLALSEMATVTYSVTSPYAKMHDGGIRWDSLSIDWGIKHPIVSERDASFPTLADFISPFIYTPEKKAPCRKEY